MPSIVREGSQYKTVIPVDLKPTIYSVPSCSGNLLGKYADVYHFGAEVSSYDLSNTDKLIIIASHKKSQPHIILLTSDVDLIHKMPGKKACSLVAKMINRVQLYITHSEHYPQPLTVWQIRKRHIAIKLLKQLAQLYDRERHLSPADLQGREQLRNHIIALIEAARNNNNRLANHPFVSTGNLGDILYDCKRQAEDYEFNPFKKVSKADQQLYDSNKHACFVWDSIDHLNGTNYCIDDCLQTIASHYQLKLSKNSKYPSRLGYFKQKMESYYRDGRDFVDYCVLPHKPTQSHRDEQSNNVQKTFVEPYYTFHSPNVESYVNSLSTMQVPILDKGKSATIFFEQNRREKACLSPDKSLITIKLKEIDNTPLIFSYRCYIKNNQIHLLPTLDDLKAVTRASERHLYFPERAWIHLKLFFNHITAWAKWICRQTKRIAIEEVYEHIVEQVHRGHKPVSKPKHHAHFLKKITQEIEKTLPKGMGFKAWLDQYLKKHQYVFTTPAIHTLPKLYNDPLHRVFNIGDHAASFFVGLNEKNPILGTIALSAYIFGVIHSFPIKVGKCIKWPTPKWLNTFDTNSTSNR